MALGAKYENTYTGESGNQYKWQILEEGGSGATPLVAAGRDFIRTTYRASDDNEYSPMIVSETTISLFDENGALYDDMVELLADNVEDRYFLRIIDVTDSNQVKWIGPIKRGRVSRSEEGAKVITLTAFDGLDLLQKRTFTSTLSTILGSVETLYSGRVTYTSLVATVLGKIGLELDVYIASKHYPRLQGAALTANGGAQLDAADNPWDNVYADRSNYRAKSEKAGADDRPIYCNVVLEDILRTWGCTLYQHNGAWRIVQVNLRGNSSIRWWRYDSAGSAVGSPNYADETGHVYVPTAESLERTPSSLTQLDAYDAAAVTFGHGEYRFMPNPGLDIESSGIFSYEPKGWTLVGYAGARYENIGNGDGQLICDTIQISDAADMPTTAVGTGAGTIDAFVNKYCDSSTGFADADTLKEIATGDGTGTVSGTLSLLNINEYTGNYIAAGEQLYLNAAGGTSAAITLTSALKPGDTVVTFSPVAGIILADSISGKKSGYAYSTSRYEIGSGEKFNLYAQFLASLKDGKAPIFLGGSGRKREMYFQVQLSGSSGDRYLTETTGSDTRLTWGSTVAWIARNTNAYDWNNITEAITDETPFAGTITIKIGVSAEYKGASGWATRNNSFSMDEIRLDNVDARPLLAPLTPNAESTSTVVYDSTQATEVARIRELSVRIGDFPFMPVDAGMSLDSDGYIETGDWEEAPITGAASGVSHEQLLAKVILRSIRAPREVHSAEYYGASRVLTPWDVVQRGGSEWAPMSLVISWNREKTAGEWYKVTESGFVDESTIIKNGAALVSTKGGVGAAMAGFMLNAGAAMFADGSAAITRTTAEISAGTVISISVESITEPIFKDGDLIAIVAPDLSFYQARISADQDALAAFLSIEDKDNPGTGVTFPNDVGYPAAVYFLEQELLTLARLGEQGFAVTVLGEYVGLIDETKSGTHTSLAVTSWAASIKSGKTVEVQQADGSYKTLTLSADAPRGTPSISFASTSIDVTSGDPIKASGSVSRADFQITADAITAYIGNPGGVIATLASDSTWDGANTSLPVGTSLTDDLKANDPILIYTATGSVIKAEVNADVSAAASPIVLTAADGDQTANIKSGDKVVPGSLTGMRIDMNNIEFTASQVNSSNYSAGSAGWAILNDGSAEFNNVTVRGTLSTSSLTGVLSISGAGAVSIGSDFTIDANGLLITSGSGNVNAIRWSDGGKIESGGGPGVMTITSPGPGTGTISMIGTGVVFNVGYARLIDVSVAASAPGQAGSASLFSLAGELYTRNGTGTHYVLLNSNSTVQVSKLSTGTNGYVLTMVGGVPAWAASAAGTTTFTGLTDTPASFAGSGGYLVRVNAGATALEFVNGSTIFQPLDTQLTHLAALAPTAQVELVTMNNSGAYLSSGSDGQFLKMAFGSPSWHDTTAITAVGTITTGTWQGTAIGDTYISSAATWNAKLSDITGEPLSDLSDVTITSIASGELLKWNGSAWVNNTLSEAGIQAYNTNLAQISSISPTNGGMIYYASGAYSQLAAGANGYILRMSLGTPGWEALSGINVSEFNDNGTYIRADVADSVADVITFNAGPKFEAGILLDHESGDLSGTAGYHTLWARSTGERLDYISGTGNVHSIVTNRKGVVNLYSRYGQTTVTGTTPVNFFADSGSFVGTSSVPASVVQAGSVFRIKAMGTRQGNASDSHTWTLRLGAVTLWSYTYTPANSFGGYLGWELDAMISVVTTGAGGTIWVQGVFQDDAGEQQFIQNTATDTYNTTSGASMQLNVNTNISTTATCEIAIIDLSRSLSTAA